MDQSTIANDDSEPHSLPGNSNTSIATATAGSQEGNSLVISDDEVQIVGVTKREEDTGRLIKIESSDEEHCSESKDKINSASIEMVCNKATVTGSVSPKDLTCSICLGEFDNKSFLDQCFHAFCFYCILQWSEIVRTCPLCKSEFTQIIHSVNSMTEYKLHKLPAKSKNDARNDRRRFRYRTTALDGRQMSRNNTTTSSNAWEQRAERRERMLAMRRRRSIRTKEKRQSIYARNLWVQAVTQTGKIKYRDTSPQFFRINAACTHRLVPWLTRELQCLLNDEESHVDFVIQLIMTLITKIPIDSEEFAEQLRPLISEKTEHFCHEFLSYARSPFDMRAYDDRAQYNCLPTQNTELALVEQTPIVLDTGATGWDSPDEAAPNPALNLSEPGPSGLSTEVINGWSPPIAQSIEIPANNDVTEQITNQPNDVIEISPEVINVEIPKRKHRHKHKHKHRHRNRHKTQSPVCKDSREHLEPGPGLTRLSTSSTGSHSVVVVSSGHDSSPEARLRSRNSSSDPSDDENPRKLRHKGKHSKRKYSRSRDHSRHKHQRKDCRDMRSKSSSIHRDTSSTVTHDPSTPAVKESVARPSSPTEDEMKREILELERKIAVDTKRLEELLQKQKARQQNKSLTVKNEDSETEGQSR